ncbi:hypothetical protein H1R20_g2479, partial [Candolleomyces eurysporus]
MIPLTALLSRLRTRKFLFLILVFSILSLFLYTSALGNLVSEWSLLERIPGFPTGTLRSKSTCSPQEYAEGKWVWRPYYKRPGPLSKSSPADIAAASNSTGEPSAKMQKNEDILDFARFGGCASSREFWWNFAVDKKEQWDRFPAAVEWEWVPGGRCSANEGLREWKAEDVVRDLVEGGGWLLIGDSITEGHFFSLSCLLYPHVLATPDYTNLTSFDRAWPQHLYLNPASPLLHHDSTIRITKHQAGLKNARKKLRLPPNFDIEKTPLVTFRRNDLLYSKEELEAMHKELHPEFYKANETFQLFGDEAVWTFPPLRVPLGYLPRSVKPLPDGPAEEEENLEEKKEGDPVFGYDGLLKFFEEAMERWAQKVQVAIDSAAAQQQDSSSGRPYPPPVGAGGREEAGVQMRPWTAVVRPYLPGHEDCHDHRSASQEVVPLKWNWWNWGEIWRYNQIFENLLSPGDGKAKKYKNVHYLPIDRPGRLRPDAHASGDCLHIMTGAGVLEGWSHYIWHYITREVSS